MLSSDSTRVIQFFEQFKGICTFSEIDNTDVLLDVGMTSFRGFANRIFPATALIIIPQRERTLHIVHTAQDKKQLYVGFSCTSELYVQIVFY